MGTTNCSLLSVAKKVRMIGATSPASAAKANPATVRKVINTAGGFSADAATRGALSPQLTNDRCVSRSFPSTRSIVTSSQARRRL